MPFAGTGAAERTDQGVDQAVVPGTKITDNVPGVSKLVNTISNWFDGEPLYTFQVTSGRFKGKFWYIAEQVRTTLKQGQSVSPGQQIGTAAASGTGTEEGWAANASGETLAAATTGYTEGQVTPAGTSFRNLIINPKTVSGASRAPAGTGVQAWKVRASQESLGGSGSCGHAIQASGYSELSTVPMGVSSDFSALGNIPCGTILNITNPANGKTVTAAKQDVGAGSAFLPVMGLYPATSAALGLSGGEYTVIISRQDGKPLKPVRGTMVSGSAASSPSAKSRPGGSAGTPGGTPADTGAAVDALFASYEAELNLPRTAPASGFTTDPTSKWPKPFQWWWQSFTAAQLAGQAESAASSGK